MHVSRDPQVAVGHACGNAELPPPLPPLVTPDRAKPAHATARVEDISAQWTGVCPGRPDWSPDPQSSSIGPGSSGGDDEEAVSL